MLISGSERLAYGFSRLLRMDEETNNMQRQMEDLNLRVLSKEKPC